jgi:hypothetical protein
MSSQNDETDEAHDRDIDPRCFRRTGSGGRRAPWHPYPAELALTIGDGRAGLERASGKCDEGA